MERGRPLKVMEIRDPVLALEILREVLKITSVYHRQLRVFSIYRDSQFTIDPSTPNLRLIFTPTKDELINLTPLPSTVKAAQLAVVNDIHRLVTYCERLLIFTRSVIPKQDRDRALWPIRKLEQALIHKNVDEISRLYDQEIFPAMDRLLAQSMGSTVGAASALDQASASVTVDNAIEISLLRPQASLEKRISDPVDLAWHALSEGSPPARKMTPILRDLERQAGFSTLLVGAEGAKGASHLVSFATGQTFETEFDRLCAAIRETNADEVAQERAIEAIDHLLGNIKYHAPGSYGLVLVREHKNAQGAIGLELYVMDSGTGFADKDGDGVPDVQASLGMHDDEAETLGWGLPYVNAASTIMEVTSGGYIFDCKNHVFKQAGEKIPGAKIRALIFKYRPGNDATEYLRQISESILRPLAEGEGKLQIPQRDISRAANIDLLKKWFARDNVATIMLKGGDLGGLNPIIKQRIIDSLIERGCVVYEGTIRTLSPEEILKRWGNSGIRHMLNKMQANGKFCQQDPRIFDEARDILHNSDAERFAAWLKKAEQIDPRDDGLRNLLYWLEYMSRPVQQLIIAGQGQDFVKKNTVGATNSLKAQKGSLRYIVASELLTKGELYTNNLALAAKYGFQDDVMFIVSNAAHCPAADTEAAPELTAEIENFYDDDLRHFSQTATLLQAAKEKADLEYLAAKYDKLYDDYITNAAQTISFTDQTGYQQAQKIIQVHEALQKTGSICIAAIDGNSNAFKTTSAQDIANIIRATGRKAVVISRDWFIDSRDARYRRQDEEMARHDVSIRDNEISLRKQKFEQEVLNKLEKFKESADPELVLDLYELYNKYRGGELNRHERLVIDRDTIVIIEGNYLLTREWEQCFDYGILMLAKPSVGMARGLPGDTPHSDSDRIERVFWRINVPSFIHYLQYAIGRHDTVIVADDYTPTLNPRTDEAALSSVLRPLAASQRRVLLLEPKEGDVINIVDVSEIDDINAVLTEISNINHRIDSLFTVTNAEIRQLVRRSYGKDPAYLLFNPELKTFLAMQNGMPIGYVIYNHSGENSRIEYLAVDPEFQDAGTGTELLKKVLRYAGEKGKNRVRVETKANYQRARDFYRNRGRELSVYCREETVDAESVAYTFYLSAEAALSARTAEPLSLESLVGQKRLDIDI